MTTGANQPSQLRYSPEERAGIGKAITATFEYFNRPPPPLERVRYYVNDLEAAQLPADEVLSAYFRWRMADSRNTAPPLPAQIRAMIRPEMDPDGVAKELAGRLVAAVKKYGYTFEVEARAWVGEDAWMIVRQHGGWQALCEDLGVNLDPQTFIAQSRDLLRARVLAAPVVLERARAHIAAQSIRMLAAPRGAAATVFGSDSTLELDARPARLELTAPAATESGPTTEEAESRAARIAGYANKLGLSRDLMAQIAPTSLATGGKGE